MFLFYFIIISYHNNGTKFVQLLLIFFFLELHVFIFVYSKYVHAVRKLILIIFYQNVTCEDVYQNGSMVNDGLYPFGQRSGIRVMNRCAGPSACTFSL